VRVTNLTSFTRRLPRQMEAEGQIRVPPTWHHGRTAATSTKKSAIGFASHRVMLVVVLAMGPNHSEILENLCATQRVDRAPEHSTILRRYCRARWASRRDPIGPLRQSRQREGV
jgi:hypothetical protein